MFKFTIYFSILTLFTTSFALSDNVCIPSDTTKSYYCLDNELCVNGHCECMPGYTRLNVQCVKNLSKTGPKIVVSPVSVTTDSWLTEVIIVVIVPVSILLLIVATVFLLVKYKIFGWIGHKLYHRNIPYDEVMIGQDDPPIAA